MRRLRPWALLLLFLAPAASADDDPWVFVNRLPDGIPAPVLDGKLDGALRYLANTDNLIDRSTLDLYRHPDFKTLFPDPHAEGVRFYKKTGIYPINHGLIIKREIAEAHPWTVLNIFKAFEKANEIAETARMEAVRYHLETGLFEPEIQSACTGKKSRNLHRYLLGHATVGGPCDKS